MDCIYRYSLEIFFSYFCFFFFRKFIELSLRSSNSVVFFFISTNARRDIYPREEFHERSRLMIRHTLREVIRILVYSTPGLNLAACTLPRSVSKGNLGGSIYFILEERRFLNKSPPISISI